MHRVGQDRKYIYTVYDRIFGDFPANNTVCKPYMYGFGQPYTCTCVVSRTVLPRVVDYFTNSVAACCGFFDKQCCCVLWINSQTVLPRVVDYITNSVAACCELFQEQCCCVLWIISRKVLPRVVDYLKNSFAVCCGLLVSFACFE